MKPYILLLFALFSIFRCIGSVSQIQPPTHRNPKNNKPLDQWIVLGAMPLYEEDSVRRDVVEQFLAKHIFADTITTYPIVVGYSQYAWKKIKADNDGIVKLSELYDIEGQQYCYALCIVEMKDSARSIIGFGSDDDASIWLNGNLIHQSCKGRRVKPNDDIIPVLLQKGRNTFLIRIDNRSGSWGFTFQFIDKQTADNIRKSRIYDPLKKYAPLSLAKDAAILQAYLLDLHPGYSRYTSKETMDRAFFDVQKDLASGDSLTIKEFLQKLLPVLALAKDAHTMLWPEKNYFLYDYRYVPFDLRYIGDKLYINKLFDYKLQAYKYAEVLKLNDLESNEFIEKARKILPRDGNTETSLSSSIADYGLLNLMSNLFVMQNETLDVVCKTAKGHIDTLHLYDFSSCNAKYTAPDFDFKKDPISHYINDSLHYCRLIINTFSEYWIKTNKINYQKAFKNLFKKLESEGVQNLVIDLRNNSVGNPEVAQELMSYFVDEDFSYYSAIAINKTFLQDKYLDSESVREIGGKTGYLKYLKKKWVHKMLFQEAGNYFQLKPDYTEMLGVVKAQKYTYKGTIIVLTSGNTADIAVEFCTMLKEKTDAIFIGQETRGAQGGSCGAFYFPMQLPASKCRIWIPCIRFDMSYQGKNPDRGILPDYPVQLTIQHIQEKIDPEMLKVEKVIAGEKK